jgi:hypothetical protein
MTGPERLLYEALDQSIVALGCFAARRGAWFDDGQNPQQAREPHHPYDAA